MKIVIDTTPLKTGHKTRGIGSYTRSLVEALRRAGSKHRFVLTSRFDSVAGVDLIHYPYFDLFHTRLSWFRRAPVEVVTIHDLIPLKFPKYFPTGIRSSVNINYQRLAVKRVKAVITDSLCSKKDIIDLLGFDESKVFHIPLGVDRAFRPARAGEILEARKKYRLPEKYILYVGDVNVNKNIPGLIRAVGEIKDGNLVIVSRAMGDKEIPEVIQLRSLIRDLSLEDRISVLTKVPIYDLKSLRAVYSGADAYIQPSWYEGFGLPVLEAMACGVPVVASRTASLPEVAGKAAVLVSPTAKGLKDGILELRSNEALRKKLRKNGLKRASEFTWDETARRTIEVYEGVAGK